MTFRGLGPIRRFPIKKNKQLGVFKVPQRAVAGGKPRGNHQLIRLDSGDYVWAPQTSGPVRVRS